MMLRTVAALASILSAAVCTCAAQNQRQRLNAITGVRWAAVNSSYGGSGHEFYGIVELNINSREWMRATLSGGSLTEQTGNVICRALDYGPFLRSQLQENDRYYDYSSYGIYVNLAAADCLGNESTVAQCFLNTHQQFQVYDARYVYIRCAQSACELTNRGCSQICLKNPPSVNKICDCRPGYSLRPGSQTECIDFNECSINNGGCSFHCINTLGSYICKCPIFGVPGIHTGDCKTTGFKLTCESNSMTVAFLRQMYPMVRDDVTLLGSECVPSHNETHISLTTNYDSCMTVQSEDKGGITYSNAVVSKGSGNASSSAIFAASINISFKCVMGRQSKTAVSVKNEPSSFTTSPVESGKANMSLRLFYDSAYTLALDSQQLKQSAMIYASLDLTAQDTSMRFFVERCSVRALDPFESEHIDLIRDGKPAAEFVRVENSTGEPSFKFNYPAFTARGGGEALALECHTKMMVRLPSSSDVLSLTTAATSPTAAGTGRIPQRFIFRTPSSSHAGKNTNNAASSSATHRPNEQAKFIVISSCEEATTDGIHQLMLGRRSLPVWCDTTSPGGPWLTAMRRNNSGLNFNRSFAEYESGFGSADKEYWLGNAFWHEITRNHGAVLRIELTTFENISKFAEYSMAIVGDASGGYNLTLGTYRGSAGDMRNTSGCSENNFVQNPVKFSTYDASHQLRNFNCSGRGGGWWYHDCTCTCLTCGLSSSRQILTRVGMTYYQFNGLFTLKKAEMKLRFGTLKSAHPDSISVVHSTVNCDTQNVTVFLEKETFGGPSSEGNPTMHSISFLDQSQNETHIALRFSLWSADTVRQENETHIVYTKLAVAETASATNYFRRLVMNPKCVFEKSVQMKADYTVALHDLTFEIMDSGNYDAKIIMAVDESFSTLLNSTSYAKEGSAIYVKIVPVMEQTDLQMALLSCHINGASNKSSGYQIINRRCSTHRDVEIIAKDTFVMRLPSFALDEQGTRVSCDVQVCSSNDGTCDSGCDKESMSRTNGTRITANGFLASA